MLTDEMKSELHAATEAMKNGGVVIYPTATIWGIGCDATNQTAVDKISSIKNRLPGKSYVLLVDEDYRLEQYVEQVPEICWDLIDASDEPLTIVYPKGKNLAKNVCAEDGSLAIRITKDPFCKQLIQRLKHPIVSTSANISGQASPASFTEISEELIETVDYVVNLPSYKMGGKASSILKVGLNGEIQIIRK